MTGRWGWAEKTWKACPPVKEKTDGSFSLGRGALESFNHK